MTLLRRNLLQLQKQSRSLARSLRRQSLIKDDAHTTQIKQHERQRFELERELQWTESSNWNSYQYDPMHERAKLAEILVHSGFQDWQQYMASNNPFINVNKNDDGANFSSILRNRLAEDDGSDGFSSENSKGHCGIEYHVGQVVHHKRYEYKGVIVGWDPACYQSFEWILAMHHIQRSQLVDPQSFISIQSTPHYHVLVDTRYRSNNQVTYCIQSNLELIEDFSSSSSDLSASPIRHNLLDHYFTGYDHELNLYRPHKQLALLYPDDLSVVDDF